MKLRDLFYPEDHGGYANMRLFWFSVLVGVITFVYLTVKSCLFDE